VTIVDRQGEGLLRDQVRAHLESAISSGEFAADGRLPSERRLADRYAVSRMTIRGALQDLVARGVVRIEPRFGAYVPERRVTDTLDRLWSFTEERRAHGQVPRNRLLETRIVVASLELAHVFDVTPGTPLVRIVRIRIADDVPMGIEESFLPSRLFPGLEIHDFESESLYATLEAEYGGRPSHGRQTIEAAEPSDEERSLLEMPPRTPVLRVRRISSGPDGRVMEYVRSVWRGDRYLLNVETPGGGGLGVEGARRRSLPAGSEGTRNGR
jgi:DNA-binding GntR family transcriptional regulator